MEVFRLSRRQYANVLSGKGAAIKGARWNSTGIEMIYVATSRALAMAEVVVHLSTGTMMDDYMMLTIHVPDSLSMLHILPPELPKDWNAIPPIVDTKKIGDAFIREGRACLLRVPSAVVKGDHNLLINSFHSEFKEIKIVAAEPFPFDHRMFKV
jgi:RES domain-containing protein